MPLSTALTDEQVQSDLEECPKWVLYKLKECIHVKQDIEKEWEVAKQDLARYKQDLIKQFQIAMQKGDEKQAQLEVTQRELLKKKLELEQKEFDIQMYKDSSEKYAAQEVKLREGKMEEKKTKIKILEEEIDKMAQELAQQDLKKQKLKDRVSELKANSEGVTAELQLSKLQRKEAELKLEEAVLRLEDAEMKLEEVELKRDEAESENERLIRQIEHLESDLEARIAQTENESSSNDDVARENAELKMTLHEQSTRLHEQASKIQEQAQQLKDLKENKRAQELQVKLDACIKAAMEESKRAMSKITQLEEELSIQRLTELELKELMEGIEKEAKRLNDEVWLKDNEIIRLREEKEKIMLDLERAQRQISQAAKAREGEVGGEGKLKSGSAVGKSAFKPVDALAIVETVQQKGGYNILEDEELLNVIALAKRESWRPNIKAKSCKLAWLDANAKMDVLMRILLKDDLVLVNGIRSVTEPDEEAGVAMALLHIFVANNKEGILLRNFIRKDVQQSEQFIDVLKSNSLASKILSGFSSLVGEKYLQAALKPVLAEFIALNQSFELEQGAKCAIGPLVDSVRKILIILKTSLSFCPQQLFTLSGILWHEVGKKFTDEERYRALDLNIYGSLLGSLPLASSLLPSPSILEINTESKRGLVLISRVLQNVAHGNSFKEKRLADINSYSGEFWNNMKQFVDIIRKGADNQPSTVFPKMTAGEALKTLVYVMGSKKSSLINSLQQNAVPVTDTYQFKTAERLISACVSVGVPHTGIKLSIKELDSAVEDFSNVVMEKPRILAELAPAALKMNEGDKLAQSLVIICHCRNRDEVIPEFIKEFLLRDINSNPKDPKYQHDGMASRTFLPYANLIATEFTSKMLTPLLQYVSDIKEELKPNSPSLLEAVAKFSTQISTSIVQLPFPIWDICSFIHTKGRVKGPSLVASFLLLRFFGPAIKNPEAYCYVQQPLSQKIKKNCALISESLLKIVGTTNANNNAPSPNLNASSDTLSLLLKLERDKIFNSLENWLVKPTAVSPIKQSDAPFPWSIHEEAIRYLHQLVFDNISTLAYRLGEDTASSTMTYQMAEIVDVIVATLAN